MKNSRREAEFTNSDFESFLFWKVFWKLIRADSPIVFIPKVLTWSVSGSHDVFALPNG